MFSSKISRITTYARVINSKKDITILSNIISSSICLPENNFQPQSLSCTNLSTFPYKNVLLEPKNDSLFQKSKTHSEPNTSEMIVESVPKEAVDSNSKKKPFTSRSDQLLEKLMADLSMQIHQKSRVYRNTLQRVLDKVKEANFSTRKQGLLLLSCCGELLPDETSYARMSLLHDIWNTLRSHTTFDVEHYNTLLRVYIANSRTVTANDFINQMSPVKPSQTTYELVLRTLAEAGDVNQATEVLANMKTMGFTATEDVFNSLIIGQGKCGNYKGIKEVLESMKSLKIEATSETYTALIRALIHLDQMNEIIPGLESAISKGVTFTERQIMTIVCSLAFKEELELIPKVLTFLPKETLKNPAISPYMQSVATFLVFRNHAPAALEIYNCLPLPSFGIKDDIGLHGRSLVRDCVKASVPVSIINMICSSLMSTGRNPIALQNACEAALQLGKVPLVIDLFEKLKQLNLPLRPHYFWPVILHNSKSFGEKGVMQALSTMFTLDVQPDYDTMKEYVLPNVSFVSPQNLMRKLIDAGVLVTVALTPMLECLLNSGQVRAASDLSELFKGKIDGEKLTKPLVKGYISTLDLLHTVYLLSDCVERPLQKDRDWVGRFLCEYTVNKNVKVNFENLKEIVQVLGNKNLKVSTMAVDFILSRLNDQIETDNVEDLKNELIAISDEQLEDQDVYPQSISMEHPKLMDEPSLRSHLIELEAKGMNTRGVLRKLLQVYCREGNLQAAKEIFEKCQIEGVFLSAGMKAAIFDLHVKLGELEMAESCLADLNKSSPNFKLDEHKVIDFATLLVYKNKIDEALDVIAKETKKRHIVGGRSIELNCWRLLDATAAKGCYDDVRKVFDVLVYSGFCKPTNVTLGPLVRAHLNNDDIDEAIEEFTRLSNIYNKTPLKHELLCKVLTSIKMGGDESFLIKGNGKLNKAVYKILGVCKKVHGPGDLALSLICALAEVGYTKTLRKMLLDPTLKFHPDALLRRCERFADEKKTAALLNLAECSQDIRNIDVAEIYDLLFNVYQREDDYKQALATYEKAQEDEVPLSQKSLRTLATILKSNNQQVPRELECHLENEAKSKIKE